MKKVDKRDYTYVFIVIIVFLLILFSIVGIKYVNGSTVDWNSQHWVFPEYFRNLYYKTKDIFPSFAFNIGSGQNIYNFSYYGLLSPMVLLSYLLPGIRMVSFVEVYMILVVISSIVLIYYWLNRRFNNKISFLGTILFLLAGPIIYHTHRHIMFINYMPFLIMSLIGVDRYFEKKTKVFLILSIFLMIMSSYYYSVCGIVVVVLYDIFKYLDINEDITFKKFIKDGFKFIFPIIISICMAMVLLLPTFYALLNGRPDITSSVDILGTLIPKFNISEILYNSYTIGTTSILLIAIVYALLSKKKNYRFLSIIFILIILFPVIMYMLSGFMYVRGKVLIPFLPLAILLITQFLDKYRYQNTKKLNILIILITLLEIYFYINSKKYIFILDTLLVLVGYLLSIKNRNKKYLYYPLCVCALVCCLISNFDDKLVTKEDMSLQFNTYNYDKLSPMINEDKNIYRVANNLLGMKDLNRVITSDYYLPSIYSSIENPNYYTFTNSNIGNENEYNISTAISSTNNILFNTYIGAKYMISSDAPVGYKNVEESNIYINENVLPIGYSTSKVLDKETYDKLEYPEKAYALLTNVIVNSDKKEYKNVVKEETLKYRTEYSNLKYEEDNGRYIINSEDDGQMILKLSKEYKNKILFISFDMNYSESCSVGDTSITINGVKNTLSCRSWIYHNKNYNFQYSISGDSIKELNIDFTKGKYDITNIKVYILDYKNILDFVNSVDEFKIDKELTKADEIVGEINVNENGYFVLSIPYEEKGFTIYLDDSIQEYEKVDDAFIGFKINEGHHNIKIVYTSPYLFEGMITSICGYLVFIPIIYSDIFKKRKKENNNE